MCPDPSTWLQKLSNSSVVVNKAVFGSEAPTPPKHGTNSKSKDQTQDSRRNEAKV
jgi:hypothetical protein